MDRQPTPEPSIASSGEQSPEDLRGSLLCISRTFAPDTAPTAVRAGKLLARLAAQWDITLLTEERRAQPASGLDVRVVESRRPVRLLRALRRLRLDKLLELLIWPDDSIFWVLPAIRAGRRIVKQQRPSALVVFMMPYSSGLIGLALARLSRLPLVLNLDDSPTCTDMHPSFPSRLHYRLTRALEDRYARTADAIVYVSATNLEAVRARQSAELAGRFHLVRYGADETDFDDVRSDPELDGEPSRRRDGAIGASHEAGRFEIVYVGAMSGWWTLIDQHAAPSIPKRLYERWMRLGRHELTELDTSTASPAVIGRALELAVQQHPDWRGRIELRVYDNTYPHEVVARALDAAGIDRVVSVCDPVAHDRVAAILAGADLLFMTLPRRVDGSRGGRISAKTYEYLMTDRPILAALPLGENRDYLADKPGVWLAAPDDAQRLREVVVELASAKFAGAARAFARAELREQISYANRAREFESAIAAAIADAQLRSTN